MEFLLQKQRQKLYVLVILFILLVGIALRIYGIDLRVLFLDEAVHYGFIHDLWKSQPYQYTEVINFAFLNNFKDVFTVTPIFHWINEAFQPYFYVKHLIGNGAYRYDPVYHGPFLYYVGDLVFNLAGVHSITLLRLPVVISSILAMFFIFLFREYLGKFGLFLSLLLVAVSPGLVYFSNLGNYENYIASFTVLGVGLLLLGIKKRSPWILCMSGFVLLGLMTIKETALVSWFCIVVATICTYVVVYIKNRPSQLLRNVEDYIIGVLEGSYNKAILKYLFPAILCFTLSGIFFVVLYSSFGTNSTGVHDGLTSWMYWKNTGSQGGHVKEFGYYTKLILEYDFVLVFFFAIGTVFTIFTDKDKYKLFISFWALFIWLVYSFIPYKTPWLILNFLLPFAISAGIGWETIFNLLNRKVYKYVTIVIIAVFAINSMVLTIKTKWIDYDKESNTLTYVHTYRDFEEEIKAIYSLCLASPKGYNTEISIAAPEYWPLPAYLFNYKAVGYFGGVKGRDLNINAPIIINDTRDNPELRELLLESDVNDYFKLRDFRQRPGVDHTIFVKASLLKRYLKGGFYKTLTQPGKTALLGLPSRN